MIDRRKNFGQTAVWCALVLLFCVGLGRKPNHQWARLDFETTISCAGIRCFDF